MKIKLLILSVLLLSGCSMQVSSDDLEAAFESCKLNGGIDTIEGMLPVGIEVVCKNRAVFYNPKKKVKKLVYEDEIK